MSVNVDTIVATLRDMGWKVIPPASDAPEPKAGQVWRAASERIEPRYVEKIGPDPRWPNGPPCVHFVTPTSERSERYGPLVITRKNWNAWVKRSGARPDRETEP